MNVDICQESARWDSFLAQMPEANNYHRWGWKRAIEETYGHQGLYLMASSGASVEGILPLFHIRSRVFGRFLTSMPFFSYGGVVSKTPEARTSLLEKAIELAKEFRALHIELRQTEPCDIDWHDSSPKVTMLVNLPATVDELWKDLSSGMRNKIRYAEKHGLTADWVGVDSVDEFFAIFSENMRNLGTPVYPKRWFENLCSSFPAETRFIVIRDCGEPVAAGLMTSFREGLELPWSATTAQSRKKYSAVFLYWSLLKWALENGYRRVDFGRCTKGSGTYEFKTHWNCEEKPLHWYYWLAPGVALPHLRPDNPRYRLATRIWKQLPLPVANFLGPRIVRAIP